MGKSKEGTGAKLRRINATTDEFVKLWGEEVQVRGLKLEPNPEDSM